MGLAWIIPLFSFFWIKIEVSRKVLADRDYGESCLKGKVVTAATGLCETITNSFYSADPPLEDYTASATLAIAVLSWEWVRYLTGGQNLLHQSETEPNCSNSLELMKEVSFPSSHPPLCPTWSLNTLLGDEATVFSKSHGICQI